METRDEENDRRTGTGSKISKLFTDVGAIMYSFRAPSIINKNLYLNNDMHKREVQRKELNGWCNRRK